MTLTRNEIDSIADDAVNLHDTLNRKGIGDPRAWDWVQAAMPAIVAVNTKAPKLIEIVRSGAEDRTLEDAESGPPPDLPRHPVRYSDTPLG